jgi:hypothetical protein
MMPSEKMCRILKGRGEKRDLGIYSLESDNKLCNTKPSSGINLPHRQGKRLVIPLIMRKTLA